MRSSQLRLFCGLMLFGISLQAQSLPTLTRYNFGANVLRPTAVRVAGSNDFELVMTPAGPFGTGTRYLVSTTSPDATITPTPITGGYPLSLAENGSIFISQPDGAERHDFQARMYSPSNTLVWSNSFGGLGIDQLHFVVHTRDQGALLCGTTTSPAGGPKQSATYGGNDIWAVKVTAVGAMEWETTIGTSADDAPMAAIQTSDGGYVLMANSSSGPSGTKTSSNLGGTDMWVMRLSAAGALQWDRTFGGAQDEVAVAISEISTGGYVLGGHSYSGASGAKTIANRAGEFATTSDLYVVHIDIKGTQINDWVYGTKGHEVMNSMFVGTDGFALYGVADGAEHHGTNRIAPAGDGGWMVLTDGQGRQVYDAAIEAPPALGDTLLGFGSRRYILSGSRADASAIVIDFNGALMSDLHVNAVLLPGLQISGTVGAEYEIYTRSHISDSTWTFLTTVTLTNATQTWIDSAIPLDQRRFYRVVRR